MDYQRRQRQECSPPSHLPVAASVSSGFEEWTGRPHLEAQLILRLFCSCWLGFSTASCLRSIDLRLHVISRFCRAVRGPGSSVFDA